MSKSGFGQMYRKLSSKMLELVVTRMYLGKYQRKSLLQRLTSKIRKRLSAMFCKTILAVMRWW